MKTTLSKVSQTLCYGKIRLKETFDKKIMSKTRLQKLYTRFSKRINAGKD